MTGLEVGHGVPPLRRIGEAARVPGDLGKGDLSPLAVADPDHPAAFQQAEGPADRVERHAVLCGQFCGVGQKGAVLP